MLDTVAVVFVAALAVPLVIWLVALSFGTAYCQSKSSKEKSSNHGHVIKLEKWLLVGSRNSFVLLHCAMCITKLQVLLFVYVQWMLAGSVVFSLILTEVPLCPASVRLSIYLSGGLFIREWIWIYKETNFRILIVFYCTVELCVCDFGLYSLTVRTWIIKNRTVQNIQNILWLCSMKHVWVEFMPRSSNKNHKVSMCVPSLLLLLFRRLTLSMPFVASTLRSNRILAKSWSTHRWTCEWVEIVNDKEEMGELLARKLFFSPQRK